MNILEIILKDHNEITAQELIQLKTASLDSNIFAELVGDLVATVEKISITKTASEELIDNVGTITVKLADFLDRYGLMFPEGIEALSLGIEKSASFASFLKGTWELSRGAGRFLRHPKVFFGAKNVAGELGKSFSLINYGRNTFSHGVIKDMAKDMKEQSRYLKALKNKRKIIEKKLDRANDYLVQATATGQPGVAENIAKTIGNHKKTLNAVTSEMNMAREAKNIGLGKTGFEAWKVRRQKAVQNVAKDAKKVKAGSKNISQRAQVNPGGVAAGVALGGGLYMSDQLA